MPHWGFMLPVRVINPSNPCMRCDPAADQTVWTETVGINPYPIFYHLATKVSTPLHVFIL